MNCQQCGRQLRVLETRDDGAAIYRTRECLACGHRCITREHVFAGPIPRAVRAPRGKGGKTLAAAIDTWRLPNPE